LALPAQNGQFVTVEFIVDTGFDGELALPSNVIAGLNVVSSSVRPIMLADGTIRRRPYHEIMLELDEEAKRVEVLEMNGNPLLGVVYLMDNLLQVEMKDGGDVLIEPL